jgi:hypothetical protein
MNAIEEYKRTRKTLFENEGILPQSRIAVKNGPLKNVPISKWTRENH